MSTNKQKRRLKVLKLVKHVSQIYSGMDKVIADIRADQPAIPCRRGCNACCRMQTLITAAEALTIVKMYPGFVHSRLDALSEQAGIVEKLSAKYRNQTLEHEIAIGMDWWALQLACPLLLENGDCGVYHARPIPCRTHMVADDPARCAKVPAVYIDHAVPLELRDAAYKEVTETWCDDMRTRIFPIGSLPKMVLIAHQKQNG